MTPTNNSLLSFPSSFDEVIMIFQLKLKSETAHATQKLRNDDEQRKIMKQLKDSNRF